MPLKVAVPLVGSVVIAKVTACPFGSVAVKLIVVDPSSWVVCVVAVVGVGAAEVTVIISATVLGLLPPGPVTVKVTSYVPASV